MDLMPGNAKLITCILPKGKAREIEQGLIEDHGIYSSNFHYARGVGRMSPLSARGIGEQQEKEVLEISVPAELADELFRYIFYRGEMDRPHGGIIFMTPLAEASSMRLPEMPRES